MKIIKPILNYIGNKSNILNIMLYINNIKNNYFIFDYFITEKRNKQIGGTSDYVIYNI